MVYAPFVVPTLCRSEHFIRLMESLKRNSWACYTDVVVSVDYPPSDKYRDGWQKICDYLDNEDFSVFNKLIVFKQENNLGVGGNTVFLRNYVYQKYDRWIQCDDDCEFSPNFLEYMDKCLDAFENDPDVVAVTGYSYPVDWQITDGASCMKQQFHLATWGLGRWVKKQLPINKYIRTGNMLNDARMVIKTGRHKKMLERCFVQYFNTASTNRNGVVKVFMTFVTDISFRAYLACQDKYCISPVLSKVRNMGFDGSGVVCQSTIDRDDSNVDTYDYQKQEIDNSTYFDIVLNAPQHNPINKKKLDAFHNISKKLLFYTKIKFFIIKLFGVNFIRRLDDILVSIAKSLHLRKE